MLSYQLLKEVYSFLMYAGIDARYMSVHSGGQNDLEDLERIRIDANYNEGTNIQFAQIENGTSPTLIKDFVDSAKSGNIPVIFFSTLSSFLFFDLSSLTVFSVCMFCAFTFFN